MDRVLFRGDKMEWIDEVRAKLLKGDRILFSKNTVYLQDLALLFSQQEHRVMALWAFEFAEETVATLERKYPNETRPREALEAARDQAAGKTKMRLAQRKILDCHAFAKEISVKADIAMCHAVGQACAVVHTAGHAIGYPMYDLTSIVFEYGIENGVEVVERRKWAYIQKLLYGHSSCSDRARMGGRRRSTRFEMVKDPGGRCYDQIVPGPGKR